MNVYLVGMRQQTRMENHGGRVSEVLRGVGHAVLEADAQVGELASPTVCGETGTVHDRTLRFTGTRSMDYMPCPACLRRLA